MPTLLEALLDSWDRNNTILVNLLHTIPADGLEAKPTETSPTVAELFMHMHYVRLVFINEDVPEFATQIDYKQLMKERDPHQIAPLLNDSAKAVREAVRTRIESDRPMDLHYDHPVLFLQHMIWHEGYHHGQIKLALKLSGHPIPDKEAGPLTWRVWMNKR